MIPLKFDVLKWESRLLIFFSILGSFVAPLKVFQGKGCNRWSFTGKNDSPSPIQSRLSLSGPAEDIKEREALSKLNERSAITITMLLSKAAALTNTALTKLKGTKLPASS